MDAADRAKNSSGSEENTGTSLFHQLLDHRMLLNPKEEMRFLLHRLIVIARISPRLADKRDLGDLCENLNQRLQSRHHGDMITGLLLLYPSCIVHIVESSSEVLISMQQELRDMQASLHSALILDPRVLVVSHDLPSRLFLQWSYRVLDFPARTLAADSSELESTEELVMGALTLLFKLGSHLRKATKGSKASPGTILDQVPELMVPQDVLAELLERRELLTPQQYLEAYHSPVNVVMDSGNVFRSSRPTTV